MDVDFVQENGPEKVEEKKIIFTELDRLAPPEALLVSSTSAITASRFTEMLPGRARCQLLCRQIHGVPFCVLCPDQQACAPVFQQLLKHWQPPGYYRLGIPPGLHINQSERFPD
jgi:hypothetical protein